MEEVKQTVEMTAEEREQFEAFKAEKAAKTAKEQAKRDREAYRDLVDETIERVIPSLQCLSQGIKDTKQAVLDDFRNVIDMKSEVLKLKKTASVPIHSPTQPVISVSPWVFTPPTGTVTRWKTASLS